MSHLPSLKPAPVSPGRILYFIRRRLKLGFQHWRAERFLQHRIARWEIPAGLPRAAVPVHFLVSRHDWRMALWMLASLHTATCRRWPLVLHEDGSLGDAELDIFKRLFPDLRVIRRAEADLAMAQVLARYPLCSGYRARMPHGIKSFDIPQLSTAERLILLDPDVLFFLRPAEILRWADNPGDHSCWFNRDFQEPSPIPPADAAAELGVSLWPQVNSGLCLIHRATIASLDDMEAWLGHPALQDPKIQWRVEQTLIALAASKGGRGGLLPCSYEVSGSRNRQPDCVARHYVGCVRERFLGEGVAGLAKLLAH